MPKLNGQLGTPLDATMSSILLACRWNLSEAMAGGEAVMTVLTGYVGEGCPFTFKIHAEDGSVVTTVQGKSAANCCAVPWKIPAKTKGKHFFVAEASSVGITGRSDTLKVFDAAALGKVEVFDGKDKAIQKLAIGKVSRWKAKAPGIPDETPFKWSILCNQDKAHQVVAVSGTGVVEKGMASVEWECRYPFPQHDKPDQEALKKTSESYQDSTFVARIACLGVQVESDPVKVSTDLGLTFLKAKGKRSIILPDGTKKELSLDETGNAQVPEELSVGRSIVEDPIDPVGA